jgi:hypothetical protein
MLAIFGALYVGPGPALAHRPYTTQVEKVALPDGQVGEARLLHGDGIVAPDPIRVVVVSAGGHLLARSHRSQTMTLVCSREKQCRAFDVERAQVLDIDHSTFREGSNVPYYGDELWAVEHGEESWGFRVRPASLLERIEGELALANRNAHTLAFLFGIGILAGMMVVRRPPEMELMNGMFVLKILAVLPLLLLAVLMGFFSGVTKALFLASIGAGIGTSTLLRHLHRAIA